MIEEEGEEEVGDFSVDAPREDDEEEDEEEAVKDVADDDAAATAGAGLFRARCCRVKNGT